MKLPLSDGARRGLLLVLTALLLQCGFALLHYFSPGELAAPSERFHAMVPLLWLSDAFLWRRPVLRLKYSSSCYCVGIALGLLLLFRQVAVMQANIPGGAADWREPWIKLWLVASLLVIYSVVAAAVGRALSLLPAPRDDPRRFTRLQGWLALVIVVPYMFTAFNIHRFKVANATNPRAALGLPYEKVTFPSPVDSLPLSGWFIPGNPAAGAVVVVHGVGANKANFLSVVPFLHNAGFNVLLFDLRGHGDSPGHTVSFGEFEARDVAGAVHYLTKQRGFKRIAAYAFSMGGSSLLHAMPHLPELKGVVVDSTFGDFRRLVASQVGFLPLGLDKAMVAATDLCSRVEIGTSVDEISPRRFLVGISPRPLLIIHGTADKVIPFDQAQANFAAAGEPKELWLVPGAGHCQAIEAEPAHYKARVSKFLRKCLEGR